MSHYESHEELLSAFVDGEELRAEELARALASPGGRETLIDFVRLRERMARDDATPSADWYARVGQHVGRRLPVRSNAWLLAAAATAVLVLGGWALMRDNNPSGPVPPVPDRQIEFEPGTEWSSAS